MKTTIYSIAIMIAGGLITQSYGQVLYRLTKLDDGQTNCVSMIALNSLGEETSKIEKASINFIRAGETGSRLTIDYSTLGHWVQTSMTGKVDGMFVSYVNFTLVEKPNTAIKLDEGMEITLFTFRQTGSDVEYRLVDNEIDMPQEGDEQAKESVRQKILTGSGQDIYVGNVRSLFQRKKIWRNERRENTNGDYPQITEESDPAHQSDLPRSLMFIEHFNSIDLQGFKEVYECYESKCKKQLSGLYSLSLKVERNVLIKEQRLKLGLKVNPNPYSLIKAYMQIENNSNRIST